MVALQDRVFLVSGYLLSTLSIYHATPFWSAKCLLKNQLTDPGFSLCVTVFSCSFKKISHFSAILIAIYLSVDLLGLLFCVCVWGGALCASLIWISVSFPRFGKFTALASLNKFSDPFSLSCPSGISMTRML